jgi:hypothetical protein
MGLLSMLGGSFLIEVIEPISRRLTSSVGSYENACGTNYTLIIYGM